MNCANVIKSGRFSFPFKAKLFLYVQCLIAVTRCKLPSYQKKGRTYNAQEFEKYEAAIFHATFKLCFGHLHRLVAEGFDL